MSRLFALFLMLSLAACATVEGAGKDLSQAGQAVSTSAREVKSQL